MRNPKIIELANSLVEASVRCLTSGEFARLDPTLRSRGIRGMPHGAKGEEEVWNEFATTGKTSFTKRKLLAERTGTPLEKVAEIDVSELPAEGLDASG